MHYYCCSLSSRCCYYYFNHPPVEGAEGEGEEVQQQLKYKCPSQVQSCCTRASASEVELEFLCSVGTTEKQGLPVLSMDSVYQEQEAEKQHQFSRQSPTNYSNRRRLVNIIMATRWLFHSWLSGPKTPPQNSQFDFISHVGWWTGV